MRNLGDLISLCSVAVCEIISDHSKARIGAKLGLRSCLVAMVPFRWATISAVKMAFSPFRNGHLYGTTEWDQRSQIGPKSTSELLSCRFLVKVVDIPSYLHNSRPKAQQGSTDTRLSIESTHS